jgi:hypothetical protein
VLTCAERIQKEGPRGNLGPSVLDWSEQLARQEHLQMRSIHSLEPGYRLLVEVPPFDVLQKQAGFAPERGAGLVPANIRGRTQPDSQTARAVSGHQGCSASTYRHQRPWSKRQVKGSKGTSASMFLCSRSVAPMAKPDDTPLPADLLAALGLPDAVLGSPPLPLQSTELCSSPMAEQKDCLLHCRGTPAAEELAAC